MKDDFFQLQLSDFLIEYSPGKDLVIAESRALDKSGAKPRDKSNFKKQTKHINNAPYHPKPCLVSDAQNFSLNFSC